MLQPDDPTAERTDVRPRNADYGRHGDGGGGRPLPAIRCYVTSNDPSGVINFELGYDRATELWRVSVAESLLPGSLQALTARPCATLSDAFTLWKCWIQETLDAIEAHALGDQL